MSLEGRVVLLVVTGWTLCFPSSEGGKVGRRAKEGEESLSTTFTTTTVYTSRSTAGQAWKSIQFPQFPLQASVTLQLETLKPLPPPELSIGKKSLNGARPTFCLFSTQCALLHSVCHWIALFQEKLLCKSLHSWKILKQANWPSSATTLTKLLIEIHNKIVSSF